MIQKIIRVGNSVALTIPHEFLKETGLKAGDELAVETYSALKMFLAKPKDQAKSKSLTPEFKEWLDKFIKDYKPVLQKLARV